MESINIAVMKQLQLYEVVDAVIWVPEVLFAACYIRTAAV